jgi:hypothetical protein
VDHTQWNNYSAWSKWIIVDHTQWSDYSAWSKWIIVDHMLVVCSQWKQLFDLVKVDHSGPYAPFGVSVPSEFVCLVLLMARLYTCEEIDLLCVCESIVYDRDIAHGPRRSMGTVLNLLNANMLFVKFAL